MALAGCAGSPLAESWPEARPLGRDLPAYKPPRSPGERMPVDHSINGDPAPAVTDRPAGGEALALRDALRLALMHHPQLAVHGWDVRVAEARALQAGMLPNPELEIEIEGIAGTGAYHGVDAAESTLALSELIELGGDRSARLDVARHERDLAGWDYEAARIAVLTETTHRYLDALAAQRRVTLTQEALTLVERTAGTIARRAEAGEVASLTRVRFEVEVATARLDHQQAERDLTAARQRLGAIWGDPHAAFGPLAGDLETIQPPPPLAALEGLIDQNPELARFATIVAHRQSQTALAKAQAMPDLTLGAGVRHDNASDDLGLVLGASLPLPLFDRSQGTILEARLLEARATAARHAAHRRLQAHLAGELQALHAAYEQATTLRDAVLPAARRARDGVQAAFDQGEAPLLDLLDAQRALLDTQAQYVEALGACHHAVAALEAVIGQSLTDIPAAPDSNQAAPSPAPQFENLEQP